MGYFSNGTEGDMYEVQFCNHCKHENEEKGCPVMLTHVLYAYEECNNESNAKRMLDMLIPREGIENKQCTMFVPRGRRRQ
jgi:hypothetical protein